MARQPGDDAEDLEWDTGEQPAPRPDDGVDLIDGTGEDYGWPTLVEREPGPGLEPGPGPGD